MAKYEISGQCTGAAFGIILSNDQRNAALRRLYELVTPEDGLSVEEALEGAYDLWDVVGDHFPTVDLDTWDNQFDDNESDDHVEQTFILFYEKDSIIESKWFGETFPHKTLGIDSASGMEALMAFLGIDGYPAWQAYSYLY